MKIRTISRQGLAAIVSVCAFALFQNCSKASFSGVPEGTSSTTGSAAGGNDPNGDGAASGGIGIGGGGSGSGSGGGNGSGGVAIIVNGVPLIPPSAPPINCHGSLLNLSSPIKMLFVVDTSGSNDSNEKTDPGKIYRNGVLKTFFNSFESRPNFSWGFLTFAGALTSNTNVLKLIGIGSASVGFSAAHFSPRAEDMAAALTLFNRIEDDGFTPYQPALRATREVIQVDKSQSSDSTVKYIVVFISDGMPHPEVEDSALEQDVKRILSAAPGQVSFNTVYYGGLDREAAARLYAMALAGNGQFLDTSNNPQGRDFPISNLVTIPGVTCN